jgi:hypothetical protein
VIDDLSNTLRSVLQQPGGPKELNDARIVFDHPTETFKPAEPTIDLFLYDVRENTELRSNAAIVESRDGRATISRPPLRLACSYLLTAWPSGGGELPLMEQQLLSQALLVLRRHATVPKQLLQGSLKQQGIAVPLAIAQGDGLKDPREFWTAIGNKLRPSIIVTATIAMELSEPAPEEATLVTVHDIRLGERTAPTERKVKPETLQGPFTVVGCITEEDKKPATDATVTLLEARLSAQTDANGRYLLGRVLPGDYTLRVERKGTKPTEIQITIPAPIGKNYNLQLN